MPSSVTEEDIKKLREARYLTAKVSHRLPARGQVVPTPEHNALNGFGSRDDLPSGGNLCEISAVRYLASLNLMSSSVTEEGIHRP